MDILRRALLRNSLKTAGVMALGPALAQVPRIASAETGSLMALGPLREPDALGIRLPAGFSARQIAQAFRRVPNTQQTWHIFPDGGACFPTPEGGWVYASNCEFPVAGGAQAVRFAANGDIIDAYNILSGTSLNCAGGATPWGTWLSCEERDWGYVWECDPLGINKAVRHPAMGAFKHEAAAVDAERQHVYMTEDVGDGCLYRFTPKQYPDLSQGVLEVAVVEGFDTATDIAPDQEVGVRWLPVDYAAPSLARGIGSLSLQAIPTRHQIAEATHFKGGEGIWYQDDILYFTTKGDDRVWELHVGTQTLSVLYDFKTAENPILSGVDNIVVTPAGEVIVAEDGGDMQLVVVNSEGDVSPLLQVMDQDHSELTGPAFNPVGDRLYFSSQRGPKRRFPSNIGVTYEVQGPFGAA